MSHFDEIFFNNIFRGYRKDQMVLTHIMPREQLLLYRYIGDFNSNRRKFIILLFNFIIKFANKKKMRFFKIVLYQTIELFSAKIYQLYSLLNIRIYTCKIYNYSLKNVSC